MMNYIETVGNIKAYTEHNADNSITIFLYNGSDLIASDTYFNAIQENAISDLFSKVLDIFTEDYLWINYLTAGLEKISDNTYKIGENDWFCRIENTRYFKHFNK